MFQNPKSEIRKFGFSYNLDFISHSIIDFYNLIIFVLRFVFIIPKAKM